MRRLSSALPSSVTNSPVMDLSIKKRMVSVCLSVSMLVSRAKYSKKCLSRSSVWMKKHRITAMFSSNEVVFVGTEFENRHGHTLRLENTGVTENNGHYFRISFSGLRSSPHPSRSSDWKYLHRVHKHRGRVDPHQQSRARVCQIFCFQPYITVCHSALCTKRYWISSGLVLNTADSN